MLHRVINSEPLVAPINQHNKSDEQCQGFTSLGCHGLKQSVASPSVIRLSAKEMGLYKDNHIPPGGSVPGGSSMAALDPRLIRWLMLPPGRSRLNCGAAGPLSKNLPLLILVAVVGAWTEGEPEPTANPVFTWERMATCTAFIICLKLACKASYNSSKDTGKAAGKAASKTHRRLNKSVSRNTDNKSKKGKQKRSKKSPRSPSSDESDGDGDPDGADNDESKRLMACHFFKLDPIRYHACGGYVLKNFYRVTQHMRRFHAQGPSACSTCFVSFSDDEERDAHQNRRTCSPPPGRDRLDDEELGKLTRVPGENNRVKWYYIWGVLFQRYVPPDSPYIEEGVARYSETLNRLVHRRYNNTYDPRGLCNNHEIAPGPNDIFRELIYPLIRPPYDDMVPIFRIPLENASLASQSSQVTLTQYPGMPVASDGLESMRYATDNSYTPSQAFYDGAWPLMVPVFGQYTEIPTNNGPAFPETDLNDANADQVEYRQIQPMDHSNGNQGQYPRNWLFGGQNDAEGSQRGDSSHGDGPTFYNFDEIP